MLIKIQGLPIKTKYQDVKLLVRSECTIADFKLDNLVTDSDGKKKVLVTVGNEAEAFCLIKCLNGYRMSSNCVLSVETLTTPKPSDLNPSIQNSYEQRSASNYPQSRSDYSNQTVMDYNRGPHSYGPSGSHAMPQRPIEAMGGRSDGWNSGNGPGNQWGLTPAANLQGAQSSGFPGTPIYPQHPSIPQRVDSSAYTGSRPQQSSSYGYPTKNNISNAGNHLSSRHDMRSTDASLNHIATGRYPPSYQQEKPITIMKDNFQGPTTYQMGTSAYQAATHGTPQVWNQGQETKSQGYPKSHAYDDDRRHPQLDKRTDAKSSHDSMRVAMYKDYEKSRQFSPTRRILPGHGSPSMKKRASSPHAPSTREMLARRLGSPDRKISPMGVAMSGRLSPPLRNVSPPIRRASPPIRRVSPSGRWVSTRPISPGRRASPSARRPSPSGRRPSPSARRISPSGRRISPSARRISPSGRRISPSGRRISPSGRRISPSGRRISPSGRRISPPGRRISPSGRRNSPPGRRISPSGGRVMAPSMRVSPSGRRISPSSRRPPSLERRPSPSGRRISPSRMATRHMSPSGRRGSPSDRRMSPSDRRMLERRASPRRPSAQKRASPGRRVESPPGPASRQPARYSPRRHLDDKMVDPKMDMDPLKNKQVRPAYEIQASSQAMYSSGYRQNVKENISYPIPAARQPEQRLSPWHQDREKNAYPPMKKQDDDRRDVNEKRHPRSRSPVPRERSPVREHYRTTSPVSRSPRRSWALEKRPYGRSPETREVPPPPSWPGNKPRDEDAYKNKFSRSEDVLKHPLVWERPPMKIEDPKRIEEQRGTEDKLRGRGMPQRDMAPAPYDQNQREPKFNTRHEFEDSRKEEYQRQRDMMRRSPDRREFREAHPSGHDGRRHDEYRRAPSPRREEPKKTEFPQEFEKDFEDIYKRAQEFRKKAEQMRMSGDRRRDDREDHHESHRDDKYDSRRDRSPHRRSELDRYEPERHYDDPKYKEIDRSDREPEWKEQKPFERVKRFNLLPHVKAKRDKAAEDLLAKIMRRHKHITDLTEEQRKRVAEELRLALARVMMDMFDDSDVSFIEIVIKYEAKMGGKQEEAMVLDVLKCLPSMYRRGKRTAAEPEGSSKMERYSPETAIKEDEDYASYNKTRDWELKVERSVSTAQKVENMPPPQLVTPQLAAPQYVNFAADANQQQFVPSQMIPQMMVPLPMSTMVQFVPTYGTNQFQGTQEAQAFNSEPENTHKLFLCKDDFEPFTDVQATHLKEFLVSQIVAATEASQGWAPDLVLKGVNTVQRYEVSSRDVASKDWLVNLDFSDFKAFNVLVYTDEELWYERAAIWLPGHSKCRQIQPLDKLKLQNSKLEGINIGKWKLVKKVVTEKGTRLYVDMPPSSACALENHKMMLSYELQKVNVILKSVAVDKNAFDAGLKDVSLINPALLVNAVNNSPMPSLLNESGVVQIALKGNKTVSIQMARKLKEVIIYHMFKYLQEGGSSRLNFVKYGSVPPNHFGVVPDNAETKRWLLSTQFGKVNRQPVIVIGADDSTVKYFRMYIYFPVYSSLHTTLAIERLRRSNQGVKGINFQLWKPHDQKTSLENNKQLLDVEVDLESVETLKELKFKLDYVDDHNQTKTVSMKSSYNSRELDAMIKMYKDEMNDSYDVANMELESSDDDIICLD